MNDLPNVGVYVIAYLGRVVYVGKAGYAVDMRLAGHVYNWYKERLGWWMQAVRDDWCNVRLDVLEPPDDCDTQRWLDQAETALIRRLHPLFNKALAL